MNLKEEERRARLLKSRAERLPDIKKQFEMAQNRNFISNFAPGGKDATLVGKTAKRTKNAGKGPKNGSEGKNTNAKAVKGNKKVVKTAQTEAEKRKVNLSVSTRKGEMVHHQRMLSQDVNAQATQHIIGVPVNKSRYNGYGGTQVTNAQLKSARPDPESVRIIPIGGLG